MWATVVIEERGKIHMFGKRPTLCVNSVTSSNRAPRLQRMFGGKSYAFGPRQLRWQVDGEELRSCLRMLEPFFDAEGKTLQAQVAALEEAFAGKPAAEANAPPKLDAFNLLDGVDPDQLEMLESSWDTFERTPEGDAVLRSKSATHTHEWTVALATHGFAFSVLDQTIILVKPKEQA
jgi:hypothetical protein